jgi:hypothetical protein
MSEHTNYLTSLLVATDRLFDCLIGAEVNFSEGDGVVLERL